MKDLKKRILCLILTFSFMLSLNEMVMSSEVHAEEPVSTISAEDKIAPELLKIMQEIDGDEKIPVWIWFTDIDQEKVDRKTKQETGLTIDDVEVPYGDLPNDLADVFEVFFDDRVDETQKNQKVRKLQNYIKNTEIQRKQERQRTDEYVRTRRSIARDAYVEKNSALIKDLNLSAKEITFRSELTPSAIVNLTSKEILKAAKSRDVVSVDLYDDFEHTPPNTRDTERAAMRADIVQQITGLTGEGVNILLNDHGWVRSDAAYYNWINPNKVQNVVDGVLYPVTNTSVLTSSVNDNHPNLVTGTLHAFANDANIFSVGYGRYSDVEWTILNHDIHLINGSINLSSFSNYSNDSPAKWFDALVSTHNVALIASGGNSESWSSYLWPQVISPSSGYNSIATGAYSSFNNPHTMFNYRYNPITGSNLVNYKPDMVIAAGSTSEASPMISGIIAMMIQLKPSLSATPELIKAIMMASCHRKVAPAFGAGPQENMEEGLTQRQGAGAIDAYRAISIVLQNKYGIGQIAYGSTDINMLQPANNTNINVSIAWLRGNTNTSNNPINTVLGTLQELELRVLNSDSNLTGTSTKTNTGKQMVYFPASGNGQYTIRVTKASQNTEPIQFAYAWSIEDEIISHGSWTLPYDMQTDSSLHLFGGVHTADNSTHELLGSHSGRRTVNMNTNPKTITITSRGGSSQGVDVRLPNLIMKPNHSYKFQFTGRVTSGSGSHDMFINAVSGDSGAGSNVATLATASVETNTNFTIRHTATYAEIMSYIANGVQRFRFGGASQQDLLITGIAVTEIPPSGIVFYDSEIDPDLNLFAGQGSNGNSIHRLLGSHSATRTVNMNSNPKTITITSRGGTSQGVDIRLQNLPKIPGYSYKFEFTGKVTSGNGPHSMFINAVTDASGAGSNFATLQQKNNIETNYDFTLEHEATYDQIMAHLAQGVQRYRLGGASAQDLVITKITITVIPPTGAIYDMRIDPELKLFAGQGSAGNSTHELLGSHSGTRTVDTTSNARSITITSRGGTSQGVDIRLDKLNIKPNHSYEIKFVGKVTSGNGPHNMFISAVTGDSGAGTVFTTLKEDDNIITNQTFNLTHTATYNQIAAHLAQGVQRYRLGGASTQNLVITDIIITEIS